MDKATEASFEAVSARIQLLDQKFTERMDRVTEAIEAMTDQIGHLSESLNRLENQTERNARTAELQAESISRLIALLERQ